MRIQQLNIIRYGKFTDAEVVLPSAAHDFHFIVGPNEAGKSTVRRAISELLYGFPMRSAAMAFLHPQPDLRLGAQLSDGARAIEFHRTKGNKNTLRTPDGAVLPDEALAVFLGASDRDFFEQMFGLDHAQLVRGGQTILDASKDVSQVLFQSAAGIAGLGRVKEALAAEADKLWAPRAAAGRAYYVAHDRWEQACRELKELTVRTKGWTEARERLADVERDMAEVSDKRSALQTQRTRLERIRRLAPTVQSLRACQDELAALGSVLALPADAASTLQKGRSELSVAHTALQQRAADVQHFTQVRDTIVLDTQILNAQHPVEELIAFGQRVRDHDADLVTQQGERQRHLHLAQAAALELGWPADIAALTDSVLPTTIQLREVQRLVVSHGQIRQAQANAQQALRDKQSETEAAQMELTAMPVMVVTASLRHAVSDAQGYKHSAATQAALRQAVQEAQRALRDHLGRLEPPMLGLEAIQATTSISMARLNELGSERQRLQSALDAATELAAQAQQTLETSTLAAAQYAQARHIVTGVEVRDARQARDARWTSIKQGEVTLAIGAAALEAAILLSDELADTQLDSATEAAELQSLRQQVDRAQLDFQQRTRAVADKRAALAALDADWQHLCQSVGVAGLALGDAPSWFSRREHILHAASLVAQKQAERAREAAAADGAAQRLREELAKASWVVAADVSLVAMITEAEQFLTGAEAAAARRTMLQAQISAAGAALDELQAKSAAAQAAHDAWAHAWRQALTTARLSDFVQSVDDAEQALSKVDIVRTHLTTAAATQKDRIDPMRADLDRFRTLADAVLVRLQQPARCGTAPDQVAAELSVRLAEAQAAVQRRQAADESLANAAGQLRQAQQTVEHVQAQVAPLLAAAGIDVLEEVGSLVERSDRWRALHLQIEQARQRLTQDSDGLGLDTVLGEVDACDLTALTAALARTSDALEQTQPQLTQLAEARVRADQDLKAIAGGQEAAAAESRRQEALAEMADASERYIKVETAATLLTWAIDRYREQQQGPMLTRAGAIFAQLTLGHYSKLFVDYERTPLSLSALRADGRQVEVAGMSEGTRDQLYLALRLAALELHLAQSKPLPFVADDLFINFDDERSTAGLQALRELSTKTQVLFLSHHDHLLPRVRQVFGDRVNLVRLPR
ncbi:ATP-binding protein [Sphaerotilus uruguayifluvii]|uniref:Uncharacterized protein YhaN n=1 Tax=Sphaerotilus uruguayifluvii TaxID=2735897 RepID=A0ABX2G993_9BURK|nr:YhaN family protein [Leptothrix sp. C29]NRT58032.1 uncharacterized protein YhaN [Leptothrix sp. C29]